MHINRQNSGPLISTLHAGISAIDICITYSTMMLSISVAPMSADAFYVSAADSA